MNDDINQLERFLNTGANALLQVGSAVVFIGAVFFVIAPDIALVAVAPIPFIVWGAAYYKRRAEPLYANVREKAGHIGGRLQANIAGISTIKSFAAEDHEAKNGARSFSRLCQRQSASDPRKFCFHATHPHGDPCWLCCYALLGSFKALDGEIAVGSFGILVFLTQRLLWPFTTLSQTVDLYQRAMASCSRVMDMLETPIEAPRGAKIIDRNSLRGEIALKGLSFSYPDRGEIFSRPIARNTRRQNSRHRWPHGKRQKHDCKTVA